MGYTQDSPYRSMAKSVSWRIFAIIITTTVAWIVTGEMKYAATIGIVDTSIKLVVYYFHERTWNRIHFGKLKPPEYNI